MIRELSEEIAEGINGFYDMMSLEPIFRIMDRLEELDQIAEKHMGKVTLTVRNVANRAR